MASPVPVPTVLVTEPPVTPEQPNLLGGLLKKKTLNTFPTPEPTPMKTPAPDTPTLKELLMKVCANYNPHCAWHTWVNGFHCTMSIVVSPLYWKQVSFNGISVGVAGHGSNDS